MRVIFSEKGYTFILIVMITIGLVTGIIIMSREIPKEETITNHLVNNYTNEFSRISVKEKDETIIKNFQESFITYIRANNHDVELCSIFADNNYYYVSNHLKKDCNFMVDGEIRGEIIENGSITKIERFINDTNIYLCNCEYKNLDSYYINIYDSKNRIIKKNTR